MSDRNREQRTKVKYTYEGFDENSPRPPVPGEERSHCTSDRNPQMDWVRHKAPSPIPRKSYYSSESYASMGFEPEGSCKSNARGSRTPCDNSTPPACLRWSQSLHRLLEDPDGIELFKRYLQSEGRPYADALDFWFACKGLRKQEEPERVQQLVKAIYKRFFLKLALPISDELRREVGRRVKSNTEPSVALFDEAQEQVEKVISTTTYPNFLKSDMYLYYVESVHNPAVCSGDFSSDSSSSSSAVSTRELSNIATGIGLPTLHEDLEFFPVSSSAPASHAPGTACMNTGCHTPITGPVRLTKDMLWATQRRRAMDVRPKPEAFAGMFVYPAGLGAHAIYNSYNPVSRQDSELQSLSSHSDARTESDNMSLTDNSVDGKSLCRSLRRQHAMLTKQVQEQAALNRETNMYQTLIPRTQRIDSRQCYATDPSTFAPILIEKLEKVKRDQESQELLKRKLTEGETAVALDDKARLSNIQSTELCNAIKEKLQVDDDNDQDILDQHVSRVFSDLTPHARSPGFVSPRPYSPSRNRWYQDSYLRPRRKDKDGFSTFSSDSGNVHDFPEGFDLKTNMVKSRSMTDYGEECDRFVRGTSNRRSSSKKTLTDLTDSGVSVVSDTPPVAHATKENRVLAWVMESDRGGRGTGYTYSEMSGKHSRHRKAYSGSRSSSIERNSATGSLGPAQPFVADPSMPPLPRPNTAIQLEEARRRLEDDVRTRIRQKSSNKYYPEVTQSSQSTLRKSTRAKPSSGAVTVAQPPPPPEDVTTVVFSFCDEQFPYRTKIPGRQITLKQFKEYLPKKGNYRYFFKTECEELGNQVIREEVSNDSDVVPLYEGKIMAQVKPID